MTTNGDNNWKSEKLEELCTQITDGKHGDCQDEENSGFYFLSCKDVANGKLNYEGARQITEIDFLDTHRRTKFALSDILITNSGTIGRMAIAPDSELTRRTTFQKSVAILKPIASRVEPIFLYYAIHADIHRLIEFAGGTAQKNLLLRDLRAFEVNVPPLPEQRRIAGILSAYDELIENSQRRITILETMARALYREWFIHFRYPGSGRESGNEPSSRPAGHPSPKGGREDTELPLPLGEGRGEGAQLEKVKRVPSPLGEIPVGWSVKKLGELIMYLNRGLSPIYDDKGDSVVINQKCVRDQRLSLEPARRQAKPIPQDKQICFGDVLINSTGVGTLGRVAQVYEALSECTVDTHVTIARPNAETDLDFFGCTLLLQQETFDRLGVGATGQTELSRTAIANVDLVVPPTRIQRRFGEMVRPMRTAAMNHAKQIQNLRRTRDLLLPRLLAGTTGLST